MTTPEITLRFARVDKDAAFDAPVPVTVQYDHQDTESFAFTNPLTDKNLTDLRWYLERYILWPSGPDYDRAQEIEAALPQWGKALFNAVFKTNADAIRLFADFDRARHTPNGGTLIIDTTEPRILRLPWELLADEGGYLFSKRPTVQVRRRLHKTVRATTRAFNPPLRVLVAVSRPEGAGFIDPRSIAVPMLEALDALDERVEVEFLRPPTLTALTTRLRDPLADPVHIVHFDGHGVYDPGVGLGFLLFEDDEHKKDPVDADRLGTLLNECGIPLVVLNACQSGQPDERNPFGSVAARLIESGVGGVVAMNYSVLVETARRLAGSFYGGLARGYSVGAALDSARFALLADTKRHTRYHPEHGEEILHLQDWFLPALYQQADDLTPFPLSNLHSPISAPPSSISNQPSTIKNRVPRSPSHAGFPPDPVHGFRGRARELLAMERAFANRSIYILHGFGGQGKTALATHAADWFTRTGLFERAVFLSFETGAGLDVALAEFGNALVDDNFAIHQGDPVALIAESLNHIPTLMVWDNFESVLPGGNAPLSPEELQRLLDAAGKWFGDRRSKIEHQQSPISHPHSPLSNLQSRLLITTRNPALDHPAFYPGRVTRRELEGLLPDDALELAAAVLDDYGIPRPPRDPLARLMDFLGCHPLSLQLTLPHLRDHTVDALIEGYATLLPGFKEGEAKARNESLEVSLRFSLDRLGEDVQAWLPRLAVFEGRAFEDDLLDITQIDSESWQKIQPELTRTALISVEQLENVKPPFIRFHPTLVPYLSRQLAPEDRADLETRYWQRYYGLANYLYQQDSKSPIFARTIAVLDMPNLRRALTLALEAGAVDEAVDFATSINRFLNAFGRWRERDEVMAEVSGVMGQGSGDGGQGTGDRLTRAQYSMESQRGERLLQQGRAREAEAVFRTLLEKIEKLQHPERSGERLDSQNDSNPAQSKDAGSTGEGSGGAGEKRGREEEEKRSGGEWGFERATTLGNIGRTLRAQGKPSEAEKFHRRAVEPWQDLEQTENIRRALGVEHTDLAGVLADQGRYTEAEGEYEAALAIVNELDDKRSIGVITELLGTLALRQNKLKEASDRYRKSLGLYLQIGEHQAAAVAWHQLGRVAQEERDWDEAERCYKESLGIKERIGDKALAATTLNQLAIVAKNAARPAEAERWFLRAIEYFEQVGDHISPSKCYNNLADLLIAQNRLDEAETYAHKARAIKETLDLSSEPWTTYSILAQIAEKKGDLAAARAWRRKEQETFAAFAGNSVDMQKYEGLIQAIAAACQGNQQALEQVNRMLQNMEKGDAVNRAFAASARNMLAGERNLDLLTDGLESISGLIVRRILERLSGGDSPSPQPSPEGRGSQPPSPSGRGDGGEGEGMTLAQLFELIERAVSTGDQALGQQLFGAFQNMSRDPNAPPEVRELFKVFVLVLLGEKNPSLDALQAASSELASAVRGLLGRVRNGGGE